MSCSAVRNAFALAILTLGVSTIAPVALADDAVCEGFDRKHKIYRLGGRASFTKTPVTSPGDLGKQLNERRAEVEELMKSRGLGHLTDALYAAIESGQGLSERDLNRGEVFDWMVFRKRKGPTTAGPLCIATKKVYDAYVVEVTEEESIPATAKCELKASGGACTEEEMSVDASGSSGGVKVSMKGPNGSGTIVDGGKTSWSGLPPAPGKYAFNAEASAQGTKKVTTHTFVIPKICLNLAYQGSKTEEKPGDVDTCTASASLDVADCQISFDVTVDPVEVKRRDPIQVNISGTYDDATVTFKDEDGNAAEAFDADGTAITEMSESGAISFRKSGTYTVHGNATRCESLPGKCSKSVDSEPVTVEVKSPWTARFFGLRLDPDDDNIDQSRVRPDGLPERSVFGLKSGVGAGAGLEYHFTDRVGLEGSVLYVPLEAQLFFDIDVDWAEDDDDAEMLAFVIGPNFHLTPDSKVDFYIGPFIGLVDLGNTSFRVLGETQNRSLDADTVFGVQLGLDIPFGDAGWAVHLGARYIDMSVEVNDGPEISVDPLGVEVGFAYKF